MAEHDRSRETHEKRSEGEHGKRDEANDPRTHSGQFSRQHHDAADTVDGALKGLEAQGKRNEDALLSEATRRTDGETDDRSRTKKRDGESDEERRIRLEDDERRRRDDAGMGRETDQERQNRELQEASQQDQEGCI